MVGRLHTKLLRDLWTGRRQFTAVAFVIMLGIALFEAGIVSYQNLFDSFDYSYRRLRFGDLWIACERAPEDVVRRIARMPGVVAVEGRVNVEYPLQRAGQASGAHVIGRFIGLPTRHRPTVNDVKIVEGRYFTPQARREALVELSFSRHQSIRVGDTVGAEVSGSREEFRVVGLVQSPEYVYAVRNKHYTMPTPSTFGVVFVPQTQAQESFAMNGAVNEVCVRTDAIDTTDTTDTTHPSHPSHDPSHVVGRSSLVAPIHAAMLPYGAEDPTPREEQPSHKLLVMDMESLRQMAGIFPTLFLGAAAMTIFVLMTRVVYSQRPHIGFLRSSGFAERAILLHYLGYAVVVGAIGGVMGVLLGYYLAHITTQAYVISLNVPYLATNLHWNAILSALNVALVTCLAAGFLPARAASKLPPAVAMRDETPVVARKGRAKLATDSVSSVAKSRGLPFVLKVPLRNLFRSRRRTFSTAMGVASGVSLVLVSGMFFDAIDYSLSSYFGKMQRYDALVMFLPPQSEDMVHHLTQRPEVERAEPGMAMPIEIERAGRRFSTILLAVPRDGRLYRILDARGRPLSMRDGMIYLGPVGRRRLAAETGDLVRVRYAFSSKENHVEEYLRVGPLIEQPATAMAHTSIETAQQLFGTAMGLPSRPVTGITLAVHPGRMEALRRHLESLPQAATVEVTSETEKEIEEKMKFTYVFIGVMLLFGSGLAFAIVFNTLSINIIERTREIASLRTLGFHHRQIAVMTSIENALVALLGLAVGLPLGYLLSLSIVRTFESETVSIEAVIYPRTYLLAALGMLLVVAIAQFPALQSVRHLDLAKATKERSG